MFYKSNSHAVSVFAENQENIFTQGGCIFCLNVGIRGSELSHSSDANYTNKP